MDDARYRIGLATARNLDPEGPERLEAALKEFAPQKAVDVPAVLRVCLLSPIQ